MKGEFKYVIQKQEQPKVCFGSGVPRDTSDKGMSPFMSHYTLEKHQNVAPNSYNTLESFKAFKTKPCSHSISKKGYGGLVRFGKQIAFKNNYPSPFAYDTFVFPKPVVKSKYPFDTNSKRQTLVTNANPGKYEIVPLYINTKEQQQRYG
ncbi:uncharacterized protein LOC143373511 isoform X2 [Andrena cerasifolii]|uniref:uncharacterized protein LOC143373511 isoform X2 n=1 Tax=Andrena cerasifolii TaxID=2819439 RepID=UPI0040376D77